MFGPQQLQQAISLGRNYLEQQLPTLNDSYDIAIVTYALHLTESSLASEAFDRLMSKAISSQSSLLSLSSSSSFVITIIIMISPQSESSII